MMYHETHSSTYSLSMEVGEPAVMLVTLYTLGACMNLSRLHWTGIQLEALFGAEYEN